MIPNHCYHDDEWIKYIFLLNDVFYQTMTLKIDFYLAKHESFERCQELCYHLVTAEYQCGHDISILFNTLETARSFDHALWSNNSSSFIPHIIDQNTHTITIARPANPNTLTQCNMQLSLTKLADQIEHLIQIIPNNESDKQTARELYQHYRQLGHQITVHKDN